MLGAITISKATLEPIIQEIGAKYNVEPALIKAHITQESNWDVNATRFEPKLNDSSWGLMQVLLTTAKAVSGNPNLTASQLVDPATNIDIGTKFIAQNLRRFGNLSDAIAAYNAGSPKLTSLGKYINENYVSKVMGYYNIYKSMGAAGDVIIAATSQEAFPIYLILGIGIVTLIIVNQD